MFIKQKYSFQNEGNRSNSRRSLNERTPNDRREFTRRLSTPFEPFQSRSRHSSPTGPSRSSGAFQPSQNNFQRSHRSRHSSPTDPSRSSVALQQSSLFQPSQSNFQRSRSKSRMPQEDETHPSNSNSDMGPFEQNLVNRCFATGCVRPPSPAETILFCNFVITIKEQEIFIFEEINRSLRYARTNAVFNRVIQKLKNAMNPQNVERNDYAALMNNTEVVDISTFAVYFWNTLVEIIQRIYDVIVSSHNKIPGDAYKRIFEGFQVVSNKLKEDFQIAVDNLGMSEESRMYYNKYKSP